MADIQQLLKMLQSDNTNERRAACKELGKIRSLPPEAIQALRIATNDKSPSVAEAAQRVLAIQVEKSELVQINKSPNGFVVGGIAGLIGGFLKVALIGGSFEFGIPMLCFAMPIFSPLAGILSVFLLSYFVEKTNPNYLLFCGFIGFLAGFLPFYYWFTY